MEPNYNEPISENQGFPLDTIQKGYPNKISNNEIEATINKLLENMKNNAGVESIVSKNLAFITLGLYELNNREGRKQSTTAYRISLLAIIASIIIPFIVVYVEKYY
ncbi:MAG: hypothetical protein E6R05_06140 [Candidatus Moraniibacteriota bacterium]|nr:MAG: hypothetical protein E6R05_06140 [Candidatus Moranbacteria bacterium]